jgi:hypothetical protein
MFVFLVFCFVEKVLKGPDAKTLYLRVLRIAKDIKALGFQQNHELLHKAQVDNVTITQFFVGRTKEDTLALAKECKVPASFLPNVRCGWATSKRLALAFPNQQEQFLELPKVLVDLGMNKPMAGQLAWGNMSQGFRITEAELRTCTEPRPIKCTGCELSKETCAEHGPNGRLQKFHTTANSLRSAQCAADIALDAAAMMADLPIHELNLAKTREERRTLLKSFALNKIRRIREFYQKVNS